MTDVFDEHLLEAQERYNPHTLENAVHQLTDYAQLKSEAQAAHSVDDSTKEHSEHLATAAETQELATDPTATDRSDSTESSTHTNEPTGDANPNHGYESDGDVEMAREKDSIEESQAQTNFSDVSPNKEALTHRHRDAESILSARMNSNHSRNDTDATDTRNATDNHNAIDKQATDSDAWKDGLRRDESDNA